MTRTHNIRITYTYKSANLHDSPVQLLDREPALAQAHCVTEHTIAKTNSNTNVCVHRKMCTNLFYEDDMH